MNSNSAGTPPAPDHILQIGFGYEGADCSAWMHQAGFRHTRVEHLVGPDPMVVGIQ